MNILDKYVHSFLDGKKKRKAVNWSLYREWFLKEQAKRNLEKKLSAKKKSKRKNK